MKSLTLWLRNKHTPAIKEQYLNLTSLCLLQNLASHCTQYTLAVCPCTPLSVHVLQNVGFTNADGRPVVVIGTSVLQTKEIRYETKKLLSHKPSQNNHDHQKQQGSYVSTPRQTIGGKAFDGNRPLHFRFLLSSVKPTVSFQPYFNSGNEVMNQNHLLLQYV